MDTVVVGVGGIEAIHNASKNLKTFALGSCIAVMLFDHRSDLLAMAHVALPNSSTSSKRARELPGYFADTALPALLTQAARRAPRGDIRGVRAKLVGGATIIKASSLFNIGARNAEAVQRILRAKRIPVEAEDLGGGISRTVKLGAGGLVTISSPGRGEWTL